MGASIQDKPAVCLVDPADFEAQVRSSLRSYVREDRIGEEDEAAGVSREYAAAPMSLPDGQAAFVAVQPDGSEIIYQAKGHQVGGGILANRIVTNRAGEIIGVSVIEMQPDAAIARVLVEGGFLIYPATSPYQAHITAPLAVTVAPKKSAAPVATPRVEAAPALLVLIPAPPRAAAVETPRPAAADQPLLSGVATFLDEGGDQRSLIGAPVVPSGSVVPAISLEGTGAVARVVEGGASSAQAPRSTSSEPISSHDASHADPAVVTSTLRHGATAHDAQGTQSLASESPPPSPRAARVRAGQGGAVSAGALTFAPMTDAGVGCIAGETYDLLASAAALHFHRAALQPAIGASPRAYQSLLFAHDTGPREVSTILYLAPTGSTPSPTIAAPTIAARREAIPSDDGAATVWGLVLGTSAPQATSSFHTTSPRPAEPGIARTAASTNSGEGGGQFSGRQRGHDHPPPDAALTDDAASGEMERTA